MSSASEADSLVRMRPEMKIPYEQTLAAEIGFEVSEIGDGHIAATVPYSHLICQPFGIVHGGMYAYMGETLASAGTMHVVGELGKVGLGMSNNTTFMRAISTGTLHGSAVAIHRGNTTWVWDTTISDDHDRVCAVSRVTIAVREPR